MSREPGFSATDPAKQDLPPAGAADGSIPNGSVLGSGRGLPDPAGAAVETVAAEAAGVDAQAPAHRPGCTPAQMRRFIKSRPYIPLHELRRRFQIEGSDDEVAGFEVNASMVFVGLPEREARMLGELVRQGEVGYELLLDPDAPLVIGVFPMRPVPHS